MTAEALKQLQEAMRHCRLCLNAGYSIIPPAVFSGNASACIMLIGQAPGITEVEAGRPFNAGSGQRLFRWLAVAGIAEEAFRSTQYMTAVTKCYPGRSKGGSGDRVPSKREQTLCRPFLEAEILWVNPELILPVGRLAIDLFYPPGQSLKSIIGDELGWQGRKIIPLPHPSGASRWHQTQENRARIELALQRIRAHLKTRS